MPCVIAKHANGLDFAGGRKRIRGDEPEDALPQARNWLRKERPLQGPLVRSRETIASHDVAKVTEGRTVSVNPQN
jgi:hypothetical protein